MQVDWSRHLPKHIWLQIAHHCSGFGGRTLAALQSVNSGLRALLLSRRNALWERSFGARFAHSRAVVVRGCNVDDSWHTFFVCVAREEREGKKHQKLLLERSLEDMRSRLQDVVNFETALMNSSVMDDTLRAMVIELKIVKKDQDVGSDVLTLLELVLARKLQIRKTIAASEKRHASLVAECEVIDREDLDSLRKRIKDDGQAWSALAYTVESAKENDIIVLFPGVYDGNESGRNVWAKKAIHIVGCSFNRSFKSNASIARYAKEVLATIPAEPPNILIRGSEGCCVFWEASGGSIRNVEVHYVGDACASAIVVEDKCSLEIFNVGMRSSQSCACFVSEDATLKASNCRFYGNFTMGITFHEHSSGVVTNCVFDGNSASGIDIANSKVSILDCVFFSNRCSGVGVFGRNSVVQLQNCAIFANGMNGVELMQASKDTLSMHRCHVSGNMRGVVTSGEAAQVVQQEELAAQLLAQDNDISGNREEDFRTRVISDVDSLVDIALREGKCTFLYTGVHFFAQEHWNCRTCDLLENYCICTVCKDTCHKGHDVVLFDEDGEAYCDDILENSQCCFAQEFKEQVKK